MFRHLRPRGVLIPWLLALLLPATHLAAEDYRFPDAGRIVAVGDIHGALDEFVTVLQGTGLADGELKWIGGDARLVSLGDLLDRGDQGRQVMDLLIRLEGEAAAVGGAVHVVLGNHEVMNLTGDLRYVSAGDYAQFGSDAPDGLPAGFRERRAALAPGGRYGSWLLDRPVALVIGDTLFVHGGVSEQLEGLSLEEINRSSLRDIRRVAEGWHALLAAGELSDTDDFGDLRTRGAELAERADNERLTNIGRDITEALDGLPFIPEGPLWYRGTARCHPYTEMQVTAAVLDGLGARRVAIGHTPTPGRRITSRKDGRVLKVDTGMNHAAYRGHPAALIITGDTVRAWYAGEGEAEIEAEPSRVWDRPFGMNDGEIEAFLRTAEVRQVKDLPGGAAGRRLVTLASGGRELKAVFNSQDTAPRAGDGRWSRSAERAERYQHEVAAYRIDRLLDLQMVPVSVAREIDGKRGALRLYVEPGFFEHERQARQVPFTGDCDLRAQYEMMGVFDTLILNANPELGLLRYDRYWSAWLMDQSRAFGTATNVRDILRRSGIRPTPELSEALAKVTPEEVAFLSEYLHRRQVQALVDRAARLRAP